MESTKTERAELFRLAYGDCQEPRLGCRLLNFTMEVSGEELPDYLRMIGGYNAFDAESVIDAFESVADDLGSIELGRAGSPVMYVTVPHWAHQRANATGGTREPIPADERLEMAWRICQAFRQAHADEISVDDGPNRSWVEKRSDVPESPYRVRGWWD